LAKLPFYIGYDPKPFDPETFLTIATQEGEDEEDVQLHVTNSIRWRHSPNTVRQNQRSLTLINIGFNQIY
jgi:hypothetical protein